MYVKTWTIIVVVVVVIAVGAGAFFGGRATASGGTPTVAQALKALQNATPAERQAASGSGGTGGFGGFGGAGGAGRAGGGAVTGSIISASSDSITVKSADGSTKIVLFGASTTLSKFTSATQSDLTTGQNVLVTGTSNTDGTVTATRIEVGVTIPQRPTTGSTGTGSASGAPGGTGGPAPSGGSTATSAAQ
jgi:Domain of unknown function (DUF5666)